MDNIDVVKVLGYGVVGLGFLLALMAFNLLSKEQKKDQPNSSMLNSIKWFMFFSVLFYGIQSLLYSLLMEFVIQKIENDKLVIVCSAILGVFVVRFLGLGSIFGKGVSSDIASVVMVVGGVVGLIVGYYLRKQFKFKTS